MERRLAFFFCLWLLRTATTMAAAGGGRPAVPVPSCSYFTARTFQVDTTPADVYVINIRQNVQGTVKVLEQPKRAGQSSPSDSRITVAVNWTSDSAELLDRVRTEWTNVDTSSGKILTIQLDAERPPEGTGSTAVVAGSTIAGIVALAILVAVAISVARRSSSSAAAYKEQTEPTGNNVAADPQDLRYYDDTATYPNSIFSVGEVDNYIVSGDNRSCSSRGRPVRSSNDADSRNPSSLNLSILYSDPATTDDRRSFSCRPASNMSTDWASSASVQSSRRSSKGTHYEVIRPPRQQPQGMQPSGYGRQIVVPAPGGRWECARPWYLGSLAPQPQVGAAHSAAQRRVAQSGGAATASRRAQYARRPPVGSYSLTASSVADEDEEDEDDDDISPVIEVPTEFASSPEAGEQAARPKVTERRSGSSSPLLNKSVALLSVVALLSGTAYSLCSDKPAANIVIIVPAGARVGSVKLFSNRHLQSSFIETDWYLMNRGVFHVYDLDNVSISTNKACTIKDNCPSAANRSLAECDQATQECVCARGYKMSNRFVCEDIDECQRDVCMAGTFCRNVIGSFECLCPPGSFRQDAACVVCSQSCPKGYFEAQRCNATADRLCQACQQCPQGSYAFKQCSGRQDNECIRHGLQLEVSSNVFAEQLPVEQPGASAPPAASSGLEQIVYIADNSQTMSFTWERPSGLQIHVDLTDFELVPQYRPVRYATDETHFMLQHPSESVRYEYQDVQANYCSQPLPDFYNLMLLVHRKRTTAVEHVICNSTRRNCPPSYRDGDTMIQRSFNTKCPKESPDYDTSAPVQPFPEGGNSVLCTRRTALLTDVFQQAAAGVMRDEELSFPTVECRQSMYQCEQCLEDEKCSSSIDRGDGVTPSCCAAVCHADKSCKHATSTSCSHAPIECATGDLLQYVVTPWYEPSSFRCHIRRIKAQRLLRLTYRITVPRTNDRWNSSQKSVEVPLADANFGAAKIDFFAILYDTALNVSNEALLRGTGRSKKSGAFNFTLTDFAPDVAPERGRPIKASTYAQDKWLANVSSLPFDVSTTNWHPKHGCDVDVGRVLRPAGSSGANKGITVQLVTKWVSTAGHETATLGAGSRELRYAVRSQQLPFVKLSIQSNQSIVASLFPNSAIDHSSVHVEATAGVGGSLWEVLVSGQAEQCNCYVGISVTDRSTNSLMARYDLLVSCTGDDRDKQRPSFWARVRMVAQKSDSWVQASPFGKLLQVDVADAKASVSYYVATQSPSIQALAVPALPDVAMAPFPASDDNRTERNVPRSAVIVGISSIIVAIAVACAYGLFRACTRLRGRGSRPCSWRALPASSANSRSVNRRRLARSCGPRGTAGLAAACVLYRVAYAAAFSVTALLLVTRYLVRNSSVTASEVGAFRERMAQEAFADAQRTADWRAHELQRQQRAAGERLAACGTHVTAKRRELASRIASLATQAHLSRTSYDTEWRGALLNAEARETAQLKAAAIFARLNISRQFNALLVGYAHLLDEAYANGWLHNPKELFERSGAAADSTVALTGTGAAVAVTAGLGSLPSESAAFLRFVGVDRPLTAMKTMDALQKRLNALDASFSAQAAAAGTTVGGGDAPPFSDAVTYSKLRPSTQLESASGYGSQPLQQHQPKWLSGYEDFSLTAYAIIGVVDVLLFIYRMSVLASDVKRLKQSCSFSARARQHFSSASPISVSAVMVRSQQSRTSSRTTRSAALPLACPAERHEMQDGKERATPRTAASSIAAAVTQSAASPCTRHVAIWLAVVTALVAVAVTLDECVLTRRLLLRASGLGRLAEDSDAAVASNNLYAKVHAIRLTKFIDARLRLEFDPLLHHLLGHDSLHSQEMSWLMRLHDARRCGILQATGKLCSPSPTGGGSWRNSSLSSLSASPCQAVPVTARQLTPDSLTTLSHVVVVNDFQKYVNSLRDVVLTSFGSVILFISAMATMYVVECAGTHYIKARGWIQIADVTLQSHPGICSSSNACSNSAEDSVPDEDEPGDGPRADNALLEKLDSRSLRSYATSEIRSARSGAHSNNADSQKARSELATARATPSALSEHAMDLDLSSALFEHDELTANSWCNKGASATTTAEGCEVGAAAAAYAGELAATTAQYQVSHQAPLTTAAAAMASLLYAQGVQVLQVGETEL